tara:strand:+ start:579 stop:1247 length:669 start_codon:yes stop_codon:yes gene_type:complete
MINYKKVAAIPIMVALASCAGNVDKEALIDNTTTQGQVAQVQQTNSLVPEWFLNHDEEEGTIFSNGTGAAPDIQLSIDIAVLNAKTVLADRLNGKLSSMTKNYIAKVGQANKDIGLIEELEKTARNLIAEVDVSGYKVSKMEVNPVGTQFRTFVQLEYNEETAEKILMQKLWKKRNKVSKYRAKEAFKELDNKVEQSIEGENDDLSFEETFKPVNPVTITDL